MPLWAAKYSAGVSWCDERGMLAVCGPVCGLKLFNEAVYILTIDPSCQASGSCPSQALELWRDLFHTVRYTISRRLYIMMCTGLPSTRERSVYFSRFILMLFEEKVAF